MKKTIVIAIALLSGGTTWATDDNREAWEKYDKCMKENSTMMCTKPSGSRPVVTQAMLDHEKAVAEYENCMIFKEKFPERFDDDACGDNPNESTKQEVKKEITVDEALHLLTRYKNCMAKKDLGKRITCRKPDFLKSQDVSISGCEGGEMSPDAKHITCPNGDVYFRTKAVSGLDRATRKRIRRGDGGVRYTTRPGSEDQ